MASVWATFAEERHECSETDDSRQRKASVERPVAKEGWNGDIDAHIFFFEFFSDMFIFCCSFLADVQPVNHS